MAEDTRAGAPQAQQALRWTRGGCCHKHVHARGGGTHRGVGYTGRVCARPHVHAYSCGWGSSHSCGWGSSHSCGWGLSHSSGPHSAVHVQVEVVVVGPGGDQGAVPGPPSPGYELGVVSQGVQGGGRHTGAAGGGAHLHRETNDLRASQQQQHQQAPAPFRCAQARPHGGTKGEHTGTRGGEEAWGHPAAHHFPLSDPRAGGYGDRARMHPQHVRNGNSTASPRGLAPHDAPSQRLRCVRVWASVRICVVCVRRHPPAGYRP